MDFNTYQKIFGDTATFGQYLGLEKSNHKELEFEPSVHCTDSLDSKLPYAHYTDKRFNREQLIFDSGDAEEKGDYTAYDDRLMQWDSNAYFAAREATSNSEHEPSTAAWFQAFLASYHQSPVKLKKIWTGCNFGNGYQYWAFRYSIEKSN